MRICVYGSASNYIDERYIKLTEEMGKILADRDHNLVFGGGDNGLMGAAARGFRKGGAHIVGVIPRFFIREEVEAICQICDELITPETMRAFYDASGLERERTLEGWIRHILEKKFLPPEIYN